MGALVNRFSFSFSSYQQFQRCPREWALRRITAWEGWDRNAPADKALAYRLCKMTSYARLAGDIVHEVAEKAAAGEMCDPPSAAHHFFASRWRAAVEASAREDWKRYGPKKSPPLFEHYYGLADARKAVDVVDRAKACLAHLFELPELQEIQDARLLRMEELENFTIGEGPTSVLTWAKPDLAHWGPEDGVLSIWDWKTGRKKPGDTAQVVLYAAFAAAKWGAVPEKTRLFLAYLAEPSIEEVSVTSEQVENLEAIILEKAAEMREGLPDPQVIKGVSASSYPRTDDLDTCRRCDLFEACKGHRDLNRPDLIMNGY